MFSLKKQV